MGINLQHLLNVFGKQEAKNEVEYQQEQVLLPRGEKLVIVADDDNHSRGIIMELQEEGGYAMHYWYGSPDKIYPVGVEVDDVKVADAGYCVEMLFHPELEEDPNYYNKEVAEETYNDYPQSASNNAKKALKWREEHGRDEVKGGTRVGWQRANQLANREKISRDTIGRMAAFKRHEKNAKVDPKYKSTPWKDKGYVAWLLWGGTSGVNWAIRKKESIDNAKKRK